MVNNIKWKKVLVKEERTWKKSIKPYKNITHSPLLCPQLLDNQLDNDFKVLYHSYFFKSKIVKVNLQKALLIQENVKL